jgi:tRNA threonylcarbamoyladenosine biosynthesis protein TsaB
VIILTARTGKPEAEMALYDDAAKLGAIIWQAHRELAETIHLKIRDLLQSQDKELKDLGGIVAYHGPGSFTGLRIGLSVANALADSLSIPIVGTTGDDWQTKGIARIMAGERDPVVMPEYGAPVHITAPKH